MANRKRAVHPKIGEETIRFERRVYPMSNFKVTISGNGQASEQELWVEQVGDSLLVLVGDAAILRRMKQQSGETALVQASAPPRKPAELQPEGWLPPLDLGDHEYTGIGPEPAAHRARRDPQDAALAEVGLDLGAIARDLGAPG